VRALFGRYRGGGGDDVADEDLLQAVRVDRLDLEQGMASDFTARTSSARC
jgi:hypothetical protein